ncbi:MAG: hypothetical protein H6813_03050 [Phycisphaeraceae bacterium]|nr:hypothetical protein [Phycisphaeraceae bacterium]MCB9848705.1 hypothetical protein [Phycisphaeraceae bacterium]
MAQQPSTTREVRLYDGEGEDLMTIEQAMDRVTLMPNTPRSVKPDGRDTIRILWGQHMLHDILENRYRSVVCGVNDSDNSHGIIAQIVDLIDTSQWTSKTVTSYAKMFHDSVTLQAEGDKEPHILKIDLDSVLILAMLRPRGKDHFTLDDLSLGFKTVSKMLRGRRERLPVASVSFLGARSNRLIDAHTGAEPSFETVLRTMFESGYRGDVYPTSKLWGLGNVGVFPSYPFPAGLQRMREGGF